MTLFLRHSFWLIIISSPYGQCTTPEQGDRECKSKNDAFPIRKTVSSKGIDLLQRLQVRQTILKPVDAWSLHPSTTCAVDDAATSITGAHPLPGMLSLDECQASCEENAACQAIVVGPGSVSPCWLLQDLNPGKCTIQAGFNTWVLQPDKVKSTDDMQLSIEAVCNGASGRIQFARSSENKCLDVTGGSTSTGTRIQLWWCGNGDSTWPNQQFTVPQPGNIGLIRWTAQPSKCLEVAGGINRDGTILQLGDCNSSTPSMQFRMPTSSGKIRWAPFLDKCIDVDGGNTKDGTKIQIWTCSSQQPYTANQVFTSCSTSSGSPTASTTILPLPPAPVPVPAPAPQPGADPVPAKGSIIGWTWQGTAGSGWCQGQKPTPGWDLRSTCPASRDLKVRALTYNLFWWNLFGQRGGNGGSAGKSIASAHAVQPFDVMGFQECDDVKRVLRDAGLSNEFDAIDGGHAISLAWRKTQWQLLTSGVEDVNEDQRSQYYGRRAAQWVRLRHLQTGKTLFFVNHHGPLPVNSGGSCTGAATAYNLLRMMGKNAARGDLILLTGDFNQAPGSETVSTLESYSNRLFTGSSFGGVDNFFSNCPRNAVFSTQNLGGAGSDHDALSITLEI